MAKNYDGWAIKYKENRKIFPPIFSTKKELIAWANRGRSDYWEMGVKKGFWKAVKVKLVEVSDD